MKLVLSCKQNVSTRNRGIEVVAKTVCDITKELAPVKVLTFNKKNEIIKEILDEIEVIRLPALISFGSKRISSKFLTIFKELSRNSEVIIFNFPSGQPELYGSFYSRLKAKKICIYHADVVVYGMIGKIYYQVFTTRFLKSMDLIVTTSPNIIKTSRILRMFTDKIKVVPLFVDLNHFYPREKNKRDEVLKMFINKDVDKIVLYVGRLAPYKGLKYLVNAMRNVPKRIGLDIIGNGPLEKELKEMVAAFGLDNRIIFLNHVPYGELPLYYSMADVFVLPSISRAEAFGLVAVEAMACGTPVITTELGTGTSFHNINGETGLVVPPKDVNSLAAAITEICENNWKEAKKEAILNRAQDFSLEKFRKRFLQIID